jgi:hypothetical protein
MLSASTCTAMHSLAAQLGSLPSGLAGCASGRLWQPAGAAALPLSAPAGSAPAVPEHHVAWSTNKSQQEKLQSQLGHTDMLSGYVQGATCECIIVTIKVAQYDGVEAVYWCPLPS